MRNSLLLGLYSVTFLCSCAGYKISPLAPDQLDEWGNDQDDGYIFYEPELFLIARMRSESIQKLEDNLETQDKSLLLDTYELEVIYLPDYSRPYRFSQYEFFAKSELKITFENGWMFTGAESKTDTTAILDLLAAALQAAPFTDRGADVPTVMMFRIHITSRSIELTPVSINITQDPDA
ncbi:MAG: hypothetical protein AAFX79_13485 [Planctomycetota bacterium]